MTDQDLEAATEELPPASQRQGDAGHDQALDRANGARLLRLRTARMTYEQIAQEVGYGDASAARQALLRALDRHEAENAIQLRALENLALDADERVLRTIISDPQLTPRERTSAVDARTRLSARRSRMNGTDAPVQVTLSAGIAAELEDALNELEATVMGTVTDVHDEPLED